MKYDASHLHWLISRHLMTDHHTNAMTDDEVRAVFMDEDAPKVVKDYAESTLAMRDALRGLAMSETMDQLDRDFDKL